MTQHVLGLVIELVVIEAKDDGQDQGPAHEQAAQGNLLAQLVAGGLATEVEVKHAGGLATDLGGQLLVQLPDDALEFVPSLAHHL